jgi:hypothetical protein
LHLVYKKEIKVNKRGRSSKKIKKKKKKWKKEQLKTKDVMVEYGFVRVVK